VAPGAEADDDRVRALERSFESLFRSYHPVIFAAAYNRLSHRGDAEDVTAEVFGTAWRHREQSTIVFTLPWLYATLRNLVGNEYRRRDRSALRAEKAASTALESANDAAHGDDDRDVRRVVASLDPDDRELIWMAYWEQLTREEMAAILGCSQSAVRVRLLRARRRLKGALEASGADLTAGRTS
jgi:RNA polymerase sigma factor (sigma-70 family)